MTDRATHTKVAPRTGRSRAAMSAWALALLVAAGAAVAIQPPDEQGKDEDHQQQPERPAGPAVARPVMPQDVSKAQGGKTNVAQPGKAGAGGNVVSRPGVGGAKAQPVMNAPGAGAQGAQPIRATDPNAKGMELIRQGAGAAAPSAANQPGAAALQGIEGDDELITLADFREPVQLTTLIDLIVETLRINVTIKGDLAGSVTFNAPVPVRKSELIELLDMLLEQQGWTIVQDRFGMYNVLQMAEVRPAFGGERATTRVFSTPNVRPSALKPAIEAQLMGAGAMQGQGGGGKQYTYLDELGVIVATDVPRRLKQLEEITDQLLAEFNKTEYIRFDLRHISAPVARERALQLVGQLAQQSPNLQQGQIPNQQFNPMAPQNALNNIGDRLTVDAQGNALVFRGRSEEVEHISGILTLIDVPNKLVPKQYFAGSSARQIADIARGQGLGEVTTIDSLGNSANEGQGFIPGRQNQGQFGGMQNAFTTGGSVMVVDESRGNIIYYATPEQQSRLDLLIKELDTGSERETIEVYKLKNGKSEDIAEVINNLLTNSTPVGEGSLLPDSGGFQRRSANRSRTNPNPQNPQAGGESETGLSLDSDAFVIADAANNQILVKARAGLQPQFALLIEKLDLRRPQVYIEAQIIAVTTDDRTRLAFETQLINANGSGGVLNTNFGLSTFPTGGSQPILNPKTVGTGLSGFTAAIIKSDQIPIIMTALKNETDSRVVSSPQLLVDDNEEASVVSVDRQPTSTSQTSEGGQTTVSSGEAAEAGTSLTITPQISEGGYLRLAYNIELSSFTGEALTVGNTVLPPPSQVNTLSSDSITVPSDSTVVVGGLVVDQDTKSVAKIPLIGDIPLIGYLFGDTRKGNRQTTLYVFLTPRILRDPGFEDLRLLTQGPQAASRLAEDFPTLSPKMIDVNNSPADFAPAPVAAPAAPVETAPSIPQRTNGDGTVSRPVQRVSPVPPPPPAKQDPLDPDD